MFSNARLKDWYAYGKACGATHMLVVGHITKFETFPTYVYPEESVISKLTTYQRTGTLVVLEIYTYERGFEENIERGIN